MICRLCLKEIKEDTSVNLFNEFSNDGESKLVKMIAKYFHLEVTQKDEVSTAICQECNNHLTEFHKYCEFVEKQQSTLTNKFLVVEFDDQMMITPNAVGAAEMQESMDVQLKCEPEEELVAEAFAMRNDKDNASVSSHSSEPSRMHIRLLRRSLRDGYNPFEMTSNDHFLDLYRFPKPLCLELIDELTPFLRSSQKIHAIPSHIKVLSALRFFASGSFQRCVGQDNLSALSQTSVSRCVQEVATALSEVAHRYIKFPKPEEFTDIKVKFMEKYQFPGIIGLIDGSHIKIAAPSKEVEHVYYCRKGGHSKNVMIICDSDYIILSANAKFGGTAHDSYVWRRSRAFQALTELYNSGERDFWLLGDSGYPLQPWLMTPIRTTASAAEERYNIAHKSTRTHIKRCIGVLKSRFRCLSKETALPYSPPKAGLIINACMVLHNYLIRARVPFEEYELETDDDDSPENFSINLTWAAGKSQRSKIVQEAFTLKKE